MQNTYVYKYPRKYETPCKSLNISNITSPCARENKTTATEEGLENLSDFQNIAAPRNKNPKNKGKTPNIK